VKSGLHNPLVRLGGHARLLSLAGVICALATAPTMLLPGDAVAAAVPSVEVIQTTADLSRHMSALPNLAFSNPSFNGPTIDVRDQVRYQTISGFGGSMTDSSAWLFSALSAAQRSAALSRLFGSTGIGLDFLRVPIGASDFTATGRPYSYDDLPKGRSDPRLAHFSIWHDRAYILPVLQQARAVNPDLQILANTWSPPAWMKTNGALNDRNSRGYVGTLRQSDYGPFAQYIVRFIQAYARAGVPIAAITPQNEPGVSNLGIVVAPSYPGMAFSVGDQERFISWNLRPALARAQLSPELFGLDESWDLLSVAKALVRHAGDNLTGIAWHCYFGDPQVMSRLHAIAPQATQIVDECSTEIRPFSETELLISTLRNWATTVADWNLALDPQGGPVEAPNSGCYGCRGVVTVNPHTDTVTYGLKFYQLGQVSAMVKPGAVRIASNSFVTYSGDIMNVSQGLDDVAFLNPDGSRALIVYNNSPHGVQFEVRAPDRGAFVTTIAARATDTFVWH
jgi:glucosylceramidase